LHASPLWINKAIITIVGGDSLSEYMLTRDHFKGANPSVRTPFVSMLPGIFMALKGLESVA
jgi:hypothetical protein